MKYACHYNSPLGILTLTSDGTYLTGLRFGGKEPAENRSQALPVFAETCRWLDIYFSGKNPGFTPPVFVEGTAFRKQVWMLLRKIPYGTTVTYGEIAAQIARKNGLRKMSARAVGAAVGCNPVVLIIPCHRVIGADGRLTGYAPGLDKKIYLLKLEDAHYGCGIQ